MLDTLWEQFRQTSFLEWFAFSFAILQVVFAYLNRAINFIFGAISVCVYTYVFFDKDLLAESILNVIYLIISISGFILWSKKNVSIAEISKANKKNCLLTVTIICCCFVALIGVYLFREITMDMTMNGSHYIDAIVTAFALGGTYLLLIRKLEAWLLLNVSNLIAMPLQWSKGLYLTSVLTFVLFSVAVAAYFKWYHEIAQRDFKP